MTEKFVEDLTRILAEQNGHLVAELHKQMLALSNTVEGATLSNSTPKYNSVKVPTFSGEPDEDVNEFIRNYDRASRFHKWNDERKAEAFPLHLLGNASVWFNTTPDLADKSYQDMTDALQRQFHSDSDLWLLRQKLNERKQLPTETVTTYAADIRRTCRRIDLPRSEWVNHFIQGLKPVLKSYVMLQRPQTLEEAENHARLKESTPDPTSDKMDQVLSILTKQAHNPTVAAYNPVVSSGPSTGPASRKSDD